MTKKQKTPLILLPMLAMGIFGCESPQKEELGKGKLISFSDKKEIQNIREIQNIFDLDYIADTEIYPLGDLVLIGDVDKIVRSGKYLYLLDTKAHSVHVHDTVGTFINTINDYGRGANEYSQLYDITVNPENGELQLLSRVDRKLLSYTPDGGQISSVKRLPKPFFSLIHHKTGYVGYSDDYESTHAKNLWLLDNDLSVAGGHIDANPAFRSYHTTGIRNFSTFGEEVHFTKLMDHNIYSVAPGPVRVVYTFDFGAWNWPADKNTLPKIDAMTIFERARYVRDIGMFQESRNFVTIMFGHHGQTLFGIHNKRTGETTLAELQSGIQKYPLSFGKVVGMDEDRIFTTVEALDVKKMIVGKDEYNDFEAMYPEQTKRLRARLGHLKIDETSNPFLLVYKVK